MSPPNAPPKLEPRCCNRIAATRRMERIIWIYGSAGSTESIIFMPSDSSRKLVWRQVVINRSSFACTKAPAGENKRFLKNFETRSGESAYADQYAHNAWNMKF